MTTLDREGAVDGVVDSEEAFPTPADWQTVPQTVLDHCPVEQQPVFSDGFESGNVSGLE